MRGSSPSRAGAAPLLARHPEQRGGSASSSEQQILHCVQDDKFDIRDAHTLMHAAKCIGLTSRSAGTLCLHSSVAIGHRVWNTQPLGGSSGLGTSPPST